jgi:hypothetical protein
VFRGDQLGDGDVVFGKVALQARADRHERHEHESWDAAEHRFGAQALHHRDQRGVQLAGGDLAVVARHPVRRHRAVEGQRGLVQSEQVDRGGDEGRAQRDERT